MRQAVCQYRSVVMQGHQTRVKSASFCHTRSHFSFRSEFRQWKATQRHAHESSLFDYHLFRLENRGSISGSGTPSSVLHNVSTGTGTHLTSSPTVLLERGLLLRRGGGVAGTSRWLLSSVRFDIHKSRWIHFL
jgi:hypothetical protein